MGRHPFRTSVPVVIQAPLLLLELPRNGALQRLLIRGPVVELPHVTMKACWRRYSAEGRGEGRAADPDDWPPADEGSRCGLLLGQAALLGGGNGFTKELSTTPACQTPAGTSSRRRPPRLVPELRRAPGKRCLVPGRGVVALCRPAPPAGRKAEAAPSAVEPLQGQGQHVRSPRRPPSRLSLKLEEVDVEGGVFILGNGIDAAASAMPQRPDGRCYGSCEWFARAGDEAGNPAMSSADWQDVGWPATSSSTPGGGVPDEAPKEAMIAGMGRGILDNGPWRGRGRDAGSIGCLPELSARVLASHGAGLRTISGHSPGPDPVALYTLLQSLRRYASMLRWPEPQRSLKRRCVIASMVTTCDDAEWNCVERTSYPPMAVEYASEVQRQFEEKVTLTMVASTALEVMVVQHSRVETCQLLGHPEMGGEQSHSLLLSSEHCQGRASSVAQLHINV
ncbi:hypothetical protein AK812_SmicGene12422 [Symbiodinium microadriaticum]|uniref:Uncharacterized protein n=1 Tax=Symbiodinium microadriaticum TaxID=2951 RepID=A0A1Q9EAM8_SYMMI|nr:hypothetical protein AK812_SmicGene12422 [Symbiodinium microadriaticum]CAE7478521.1 unnamed protein product [Symbiodinium sp. KB8]CAE7829397.1 unnamed protein product [Symbiodinium microadriaticum]